MNDLVNLVTGPSAKLIEETLFLYWIFSAAVVALPAPDDKSSKGYVFLYRFAHAFAGNLDRAAAKLNVPGAQSGS